MVKDLLHRITLFLAIMSSNAALAQQAILPPAPNAAALGQYGDIGVSYYTGTPSIAVPLYTIKTGSHLLDLSLTYNASGVRVAEEASWVGLGWTLNAGGVVTRTVLGNDDLRDDRGDNTDRRLGFPFSPALPPYNLYNYYDGSFSDDDKYYFQYSCDPARGGNDTQPDIFFFNFAGHTGKFVMDKPMTGNSEPVIRLLDEGANCRIRYDRQNKSWIITTEDGYQYFFSDTEQEIQVEPRITDFTYKSYTSAWYLSRIVAPATGEEINFSYKSNGYTSQVHRSYWDKQYVDRRGSSGGFCENVDYSTLPPKAGGSESQTQVNGVILHKIRFATGEVEFKISTRKDFIPSFIISDQGDSQLINAQKITGLVVRDLTRPLAQTQVITNINLEQSYFNNWASRANPIYPGPILCSNSSPIDITQFLRLKLEAVVQGVGTGNPSVHRFTYQGETPPKNSPDKDYMGYYNGAQNKCEGNFSTIFLPSVTVTLSSGKQKRIEGANDRPNINYMTAGTLTDITYPTGGSTQFRYEAHTFRTTSANIVTQNRNYQPGSGLRIERIVTKESSVAMPTIRRYVYTMPTDANISSGLQMAPYLHTLVIDGAMPGGEGGCYTFTQVSRSSSSTITLGTAAQGQAFGYDFVIVLEGENGENGKTEYTFDNQEETIPVFRYVVAGIPNKISPTNGLLRKATIYKKQNNTYFKVKETTNEYQTGANPTSKTTHTVKGAIVPNDVCDALSSRVSALGYVKYYDIDSYWTRLTAKHEKTYNSTDNGFIEQHSYYTYGNAAHRQLTTTRMELADGKTIFTRTLYPNDYPLLNGPVYEMANKLHVINAPVESYSSILRGGQEHITAGTFTEYSLTGSLLTRAQPTRMDVFRSSTAIPASAFLVSNAPGNTQPRPDERYYKPEQYLTYEPTSGMLLTKQQASHSPHVYVWDYGKTWPVAEFINATPEQVAYTSFEADVPAGPYGWQYDPRLSTATNPTHWRQSGGMTGRSCYRLDGGWGVSRENLPAGDYELSFWATATPSVFVATELGRWIGPANALNYRLHRLQVRVTSANPRIVIDAYGILVDIDEIRLHPVSAQITSYTYDALTGNPTSIGDINNFPSIYEYDSRNRLKLVRDHMGNILKHYTYHYKEQ